MEDYLQSEEYKKYEKKMIDKKKTIIHADNAIHLDYLGKMISEEDIKRFEEIAKNSGLQLSRFDKSGVMHASLDQYSLITYLFVAQPVIGGIIIGVGANAMWDAIKYILISTWKNVRNKSYQKISSGEIQDKKLTFGLKVSLDENTGFDFELSGDFDEKVIDKSLNKVLKFLKDKKINEEYQHPKYVYYSPERDEWIEINVEEEIRKNILEQRNNISKNNT